MTGDEHGPGGGLPRRRRTRAQAQVLPRVKLGPQTMVRAYGSAPVDGRPDEAEQAQLAATVGARLRELRRAHGLSLRDLERRSGVHRATISRIERGLRRPRESALGWLAWGLVGADAAGPVRADLCAAAGGLAVAESRWSERAHARRAWAAAKRGELQLPSWLVGPYIISILGNVLPDEMPRLREAQAAALEGRLPWPEVTTMEALHLANEMDGAGLSEFRAVGRGVLAEGGAKAARDKRRRVRADRAAAGLTGTSSRRSARVPDGLSTGTRLAMERALDLKRESRAELDYARKAERARQAAR